MKIIGVLLITLITTSCASTIGLKTFEQFSAGCDQKNYTDCYRAAIKIFNLRPDSLEACTDNRTLCIKPDEDRKTAMRRISDIGIDYNILSCEQQNNATACMNAASSLSTKSSAMPLETYKPVASQAEKYFEKGCKLGNKISCALRGTSYRAGT